MNLATAELPWWKKQWDDNPLKVILLIAFLLRLLASFFAKGYAFHDDHFDVIRVAQDWVDGFPHWVGESTPPNHSIFYAGVNAVFLYLLEAVGISDTQLKMIFIRLMHGLYSLLTVYYGYKIAEKIGDKRSAILVGLILAILWFMPQLGVKNLAELVCVPPILAGYYLVIKNNTQRSWLVAGLLFGLAFSIRLHVILFAGGSGLMLLINKQWRSAITFTVGYLLASFLIIGVIDMTIWSYPFQSLAGYFMHNTGNAYGYITGPPYKFMLTLLGFTVPPVSIMLFFGFLKIRKIEPYMFWGGVFFFIFHSIFPNKQERFILPFIPIFIILGTAGWCMIVQKSQFWAKRVSLYKGMWIFFWVLNFIVAVALSLSYSKKDRIEPLYYLSKMNDVESVVVQSESKMKLLPVYYYGTYSAQSIDYHKKYGRHENRQVAPVDLDEGFVLFFFLDKNSTIDDLKTEIQAYGATPNYVILKGLQDLPERVSMFENLFSKKMRLQKTIEPDFFDAILHYLNPKNNRNEMASIYRLE
ncbi:MAG: glycosyltransferase family 39 protein [Bacteroidota bacterium]